jgi:flavin-dependent dehydrogenase
MTEIAVIGGGPAGAAASIACARAGLQTILFEHMENASDRAEPEESISPECAALLQDLDIDCHKLAAPFAGIMVGHDIAMFGRAMPFAGFHVRRSSLDRLLRNAAARAGAELRMGVEVLGLEIRDDLAFHLRTRTGWIAARVVIDGTGRRCWLARTLSLGRRRLSPALIAWRDVVRGDRDRSGVFARFIPNPNGWTWLAEISEERVVRTQLAPAGKGHGDQKTFLSASATAHAASWYLVRRLAGSGWFIAGDAAAAFDPAAGSGVAFALRSGLAAGAAAVAASTDSAVAPVIAARYHDALTRECETTAAALAHHYRRLGIRVLVDNRRS